MAISDYIRTRVLDYSVPWSRAKLLVPKSVREIRYKLRQIGNNLNQQTRVINEVVTPSAVSDG